MLISFFTFQAAESCFVSLSATQGYRQQANAANIEFRLLTEQAAVGHFVISDLRL
jgi:hypothetical protein